MIPRHRSNAINIWLYKLQWYNDHGPCYHTVGPLRIGDDVITKDSLFVIIVEIDTRIYKTYPKLDYTIVHPKYPRDSLSSIYIMQ